MTPAVERAEHHRRLLVALMLAVLAIVVGVSVGVDAHASTERAQVAGSRVAAHNQVAGPVVAASEDVRAGERRGTTTQAGDVAIGSRVAPNTAGLALPSGRFTNGTFAPGKLEAHFAKHADEWGAIGIEAYQSRARSLLSSDIGSGIRGFTRTNGDVVRYNVRTNEFAVGASDGTIRTLFRPDDGLDYYLSQVPG